MSTTTNMGLNKPATTDTVNIGDLNANMDKLDDHRHLGGSDGLAVKAVQSGSLAARPADVTAGQLYVATDGPSLHFADGARWLQVSPGLMNLLVNGGFEIWQRGNGPFTTSGAYNSDRWYAVIAGTSSYQVDREATTIDGKGKYALKLAYTHAASSYVHLIQRLSTNDFDLRSVQLSFSIRIRQGVANSAEVAIIDYNGTTEEASYANSSTTGSFVTLTVTKTIRSNLGAAGWVDIRVIFNTVSDTVYLDNAMLVAGSTALDYMPLTPAEEWERCQRYYESQGGLNGTGPCYWTYCSGGGQWAFVGASFGTRKAVIPTLTKNGTWNVNNCPQPSVSNPTMTAYQFLLPGSSGAGQTYAQPQDSSCTVVAEANP